jgi:hypothetical protein
MHRARTVGPGREGNAMSRFLKMSAIALLALFFLVPAASAQRGGAFVVRGGFYGGGWGWYGPGWGWGWGGYYPYYGWGYPYEYGSSQRYGDVKITGVGKDALVYVDSGYAGRAGQLKKFRLSVGNHNIELRDPSGHAFHQEKIHILPGKTLEIQGTIGGH